MCNNFTEKEIDEMLELPRMEDLKTINDLSDEVEGLKRQINSLKKWIKNYTGVDMKIEDIVEQIEEYEREKTELFPDIDVFNYGRIRVEEKERMAESL